MVGRRTSCVGMAHAILLLTLVPSSLSLGQTPAGGIQIPLGSIAPLPAPIEISHRPIGRVQYRSVAYAGDIKLTGRGFTLTEADGDLLRFQNTLESIEFSAQGQSIDIPIAATHRVKLRRDGEHVEIGALEMSVPESPPDGKISAKDWQIIKDKLMPAARQAMEQARIQWCIIFPRFPGNRAGNDTPVTLASRADMIRLDLECRTAAGDQKSADGLKMYRRDPVKWVADIDRRLKESGMTIETDLRVRGTAMVNGHEFLVISGNLQFRGRGRSAAETFGIAVPAGMTLDSFEGVSQIQILVDPYSGAIERSVSAEKRTFTSGPGSTASIPSPQESRSEYAADIPRFYAAVPMPPPSALPPRAGQAPAAPVPAPRIHQEPKTLVSLYRDTIGSVFTVRAGSSLGTAFAAGGNVLITARHVVKDAKIVDLENTAGHRFTARVLLPTADIDIAYLVPTSPQRLTPLAMAADVPPIGTKLVVIGSPAGLDGTLTTGTVSQLRPFKGRLFLQFEGFVSPGNSGGPIMDLEGKVLGIVMARGSPEVALGVNIGVSTVDVLGEAPREARALISRK